MSTQLTLQDKLLAPLTFDKEKLSIIGNSDADSGIALAIIFVSSLLSGLIAYITEDAGFAGTLGSADSQLQYFLIGFLFQLLILLVFSWVQGFVVRGFGGQCSTAAALRMLGFASVWSIIGTLITFVVPGFGGVIGFIAFLAFAFGLSAMSGLGFVSAIIAVILAFILAMILVAILFFILVVAVLFAILS